MRKIITLLFIVFLSLCKNINCAAQVNVQDSSALVDLYNSTNGSSWYKNTGWLSGPVSNWYGVTVAGGRVTNIILDSNNLVGPLPSSLGNLSELTVLSMYQNQLNDSIPPSFANLSNLTNVILSYNQLTGSIPSFIGNFTNLVQLDLTFNQLKGFIPTSLGNLSNLQILAIGGNDGVTGGIPNFIGSLTNLTYLDLSGEQILGGTIPDTLRNLKKLQTLLLGYNELTDSIPSWLPSLPVLSNLQLQFNHLNGGIPASLGSVSSLTYLDLSENFSYGGLAGTIPAELGNLSNLTYLNLAADLLTGSIPTTLGDLSNLTYMDLGANNFTGTTIPSSLGNLSNLAHMALDADSLTGNIPTQLGNLSKLNYLDLSTNEFSGGIPASFGNLTAMSQLYLHDDNLSDTIPSSLGNLSNIIYLYLDNNQLTGNIPTSLGNMKQVQSFFLYHNQLSGTIPTSLGNLNQAVFFSLSYNQLSGTIPASFGNLTQTFIGVNNNQLTGPVPSALGKIKGGISIEDNKLDFDSLEQVIVQQPSNFTDSPQAPIQLHLNGNLFSVSAGGTLANDTFHWYKDNVLYQTITGDSTLTATISGNYSVQVTNKIITPATGLVLYSDTLNSVLPLTFLSFSGEPGKNDVLLNWQTTNEINTSYFVIQRSTDGMDFTDIGKVKAAANRVSINNYSFTDNAPANGINYYRLKETDIDGIYSYSTIVSVDLNYSGPLSVYPNPAHNSITINLLPLANVSMLLLYDDHGKLVMKQSVESNTFMQGMDISKLAAGAYNIIWQQDNIKQVLKVVKQ